MDVDKTLYNSTNGDFTKTSTQDPPFVQVHHDQ